METDIRIDIVILDDTDQIEVSFYNKDVFDFDIVVDGWSDVTAEISRYIHG